jgi:hypothetical protein
MRLLAGLAIALGCSVVGEAVAQTVLPAADASQLRDAAFARDLAPRVRTEDGLFSLLEQDRYLAGQGPIRWGTNQLSLGKRASGANDSLRLSLGGVLRPPGGLPLNMDRADFAAQAYEIAVTRDWAPVKFDAGAYDVHLAPHAGVGMSNAGGQAEAGAMLTVGQKRDDIVQDRLSDMGVSDGAAFGDQGRWYLFAAASGRAVGMNMLRKDNGWDRAGWSTDPSSALIGDAQVGVGWRKGVVQTSFGYVHREVKGEHMVFGQKTKEDSLLAFSLSIKPGR